MIMELIKNRIFEVRNELIGINKVQLVIAINFLVQIKYNYKIPSENKYNFPVCKLVSIIKV